MFDILTFRLGPGVSDDQFFELDRRVQEEFSYHQPGFLRRTLGRHDDGRWLALTLWADTDAADAADTAFAESPLGREFRGLLVDVVGERFHGVD